MHNEYAIEPSLINSFDRFRALIDGKCGWEHGRVVAEFPKRWKREVYKACAECRPVERKSIENYLKTADFLIRRSDTTSRREQENWINYALREDERLSFAAVIADGFANGDQVLDGTVLTSNIDKWQPRTGIRPRRPEELAKAAAILMRNSSRIVFVDPHFSPCKHRYRDSLRELLSIAIEDGYKRTMIKGGESIPINFELHYLSKPPAGEPDSPEEYSSRLKNVALQYLSEVIPAGHKLNVFIWGRHQDDTTGRNVGERFHNRYILTELGGISFGTGLDPGATNSDRIEETDDLARLPRQDAKIRLEQYSKSNATFICFQEFVIDSVHSE